MSKIKKSTELFRVNAQILRKLGATPKSADGFEEVVNWKGGGFIFSNILVLFSILL